VDFAAVVEENLFASLEFSEKGAVGYAACACGGYVEAAWAWVFDQGVSDGGDSVVCLECFDSVSIALKGDHSGLDLDDFDGQTDIFCAEPNHLGQEGGGWAWAVKEKRRCSAQHPEGA